MYKSLLVFFLLLRLNAMAGDTTFFKEPISIKSLGATIREGTLLLQSRNLKFRFAVANTPFKLLILPDTAFATVKFKKCFMGMYGGYSLPYEPEYPVGKRLEFDSCELNYLNLPKVSGETAIYSSKIGVASFDSSVNLILRLNSNPSLEYLVTDNCRNLEIDVHDTRFNDSAIARIMNSSISQFSFIYCKTGGSEFQFIKDSLTGSAIFSRKIGEESDKNKLRNYPYQNIFTFSDCFINCSFIYFDEIPNSQLVFENCVFGPRADLREMHTKKIVFKNCRFPEIKTSLNVFSTEEQIELGFVNSDVENIRMDFLPTYKIVFDSGYSHDIITNNYERLINKFKSEGKANSTEVVDIQYHQYQDSKWWSFIEKIWWNYGYNKSQVFGWAIFFLTLFYVINFFSWPKMNSTYPIVPLYTTSKASKRLLVFLFTVYVFFALRINLEKLNFEKQRYIILFFVQYAVGLGILFFIVRAVLKF